MRRHMTDEGWQIFDGLEKTGWFLSGHGIDGRNNVQDMINHYKPNTVLIQDKREWQGLTAGRGFDLRETFTDVNHLKNHTDIFKLTIIKDAHSLQEYNTKAAKEIDCHAWVTYYHPDIVCHLSPFIRREHLIRTYHTVDAEVVPTFSEDRLDQCFMSGAISAVYPLRQRVVHNLDHLHRVVHHKHPGYGRKVCCTNSYLQELSKYKVAICTSSIFGFALRKIIEATVCGCRVITDLPIDEFMPWIDNNLIRVTPDITVDELDKVIQTAIDDYNPDVQRYYVEHGLKFYNHRSITRMLSQQIEDMRLNYGLTTS
jgi:hypothetical protein